MPGKNHAIGGKKRREVGWWLAARGIYVCNILGSVHDHHDLVANKKGVLKEYDQLSANTYLLRWQIPTAAPLACQAGPIGPRLGQSKKSTTSLPVLSLNCGWRTTIGE